MITNAAVISGPSARWDWEEPAIKAASQHQFCTFPAARNGTASAPYTTQTSNQATSILTPTTLSILRPHTHTHSQTPHTHTQPQTLIYTVIPWEWLKLRFLCLLLKKSTAPMETQLVWESIPYLHKSGECQIIPSGCDCGLPIVFCLSSIVRGHVPGMAIDTTEARTLKQKVSFLFVHL